MAVNVRDAGPGKARRDWGAVSGRVARSAASLLVRRWHYTLPGSCAALVFACLSLTPSLLPRNTLFQGVVTGITAAIGYALGVLGAWLWREFADRGPRTPTRRAWAFFFAAGGVALAVSLVLGQIWQHQLRALMGVPQENPFLLAWLLFVAAILFVALVGLGRALRRIYRWLSGLFARRMGARAARGLGIVVVVVTTAGLVSGVLWDGLLSLADRAFAVRDLATPAGVVKPSSDLRSGGPGSLIPWDSLGREGRKFTGGGPTTEAIAAFNGSPAQEPIRIYAGTASASNAEGRAALAVRDLDRAGGFDRSYLVVLTTTGSGWVDASASDSFEYMTGGDSAIIAMQYSHLPSWLSYLVDQEKAREAGRELFDAAYGEWAAMPTEDRPKLIVFGESLGSFGGETAFSGEHDLANRTYGSLFVGPPSFNHLYRDFTDDRDPGTPEVSPVYRDGRTVRFSNDPEQGIPPNSAPWSGPRVLYLQHPSDPIVWWSPTLIWDEPDWLDEPPGSDVVPQTTWIPFVTFWQITADLPLAMEVPAGHGHQYAGEHVDGWNAILHPEGWTEAKLARLRNIALAEQ
ncbi:MAG: alpha/beta hydrolase [Nocardioidaceae bacterium]